ncbi:MAG TPA: C45 family peptidase [Solirubrobacteraceae bacterium]|nr:C45 family peptidase [Solirubrobacteraceae bacterium]
MLHRIRVEGTALERGEQYGEQARELIARCIEIYGEAFAHYAGWDWEQVREHAGRFREPILAFDREYVDELEGIARGAGLEFADVLAINVRTEVMFAAMARDATEEARIPPECTSIAVAPSRTRDGRLLTAQNWDWLVGAAETLVLLEVAQPRRPDFVTVVEAGLLAKAGMNSAGIALTTNALVCDRDTGSPGVPYHVLLRAILDSETASDALATLSRAPRASSANYIVAQDRVVLDFETAPGDLGQIFLGYPDDDVLLHTNHFVNPRADVSDVGFQVMPDSPFRLARLRQLIADRSAFDAESLRAILADHDTFPLGVCCHPDPRVQNGPAYRTVATVIFEPATRTMWVCDGNPCEAPMQRLQFGEALGRPTTLAASPPAAGATVAG